ncbi:hypothetical protein AKJ36_00045 [candidate division MSBL1 archaeon SCGC-AAA259I07]|uniref:Uncharacterized protein n=1 Tax=candidate division MSBL1 archaeon SCGC-AAA259I07 TaxID=1698266 RepID=A0A133UN20_9EURY|nr:hypothetical protein AKJ36_00045 [candidate division MSBL1 archaeon SCGC-AAA259I07]
MPKSRSNLRYLKVGSCFLAVNPFKDKYRFPPVLVITIGSTGDSAESVRITSTEEFEAHLEEVYPHLCQSFHLSPEEAPEPPEVITATEAEERTGRPKDDYIASYIPGLGTLTLNEHALEQNDPEGSDYLSSRKSLPVSEVGHEATHYLRDRVGPGDKFPEDNSVIEFFGRLGRRVVADRYGEHVAPGAGVVTGGELVENYMNNRNKDVEEVRVEVIEDAKNSDPRDATSAFSLWMNVTHYAGNLAADENYPDVLNDDQLIRREADEIRDRFRILEREYEAFKKAKESHENFKEAGIIEDRSEGYTSDYVDKFFSWLRGRFS